MHGTYGANTHGAHGTYGAQAYGAQPYGQNLATGLHQPHPGHQHAAVAAQAAAAHASSAHAATGHPEAAAAHAAANQACAAHVAGLPAAAHAPSIQRTAPVATSFNVANSMHSIP